MRTNIENPPAVSVQGLLSPEGVPSPVFGFPTPIPQSVAGDEQADFFVECPLSMSRAEAEAIIGKPPGNYQTRHFNSAPIKIHENMMAWHTDEAVVLLVFNDDGKLVQQAQALPMTESVWEKAGRWLGF